MAASDDERKRLASVYSRMADEELLRILNSGDELTNVAQESLSKEIAKRHLQTDSAPLGVHSLTAAGEDAADANIHAVEGTVLLRRYTDLPEALLAKGSLESAGIECYLLDENVGRIGWNLLGDVELHVLPEDLEAAEAILSQPIPEKFEVQGIGDFEQPKCPNCQSLDISVQESPDIGLREVAKISDVALVVPISVRKRAWFCHDCHARWEEADDPVPDPESH